MRSLLLVLLLAASSPALAQSTPNKKEALQQRKAQLQDEIDLANSILKKTRSDKQLSLTQVRALEQKVRARESLIRTIDSEVRSIDGAIGQQKLAISQMDQEIQVLKEKYAGMLRAAQKRRTYKQQWAFVFSAESVSQALKRLYFLRHFLFYAIFVGVFKNNGYTNKFNKCFCQSLNYFSGFGYSWIHLFETRRPINK